MGIMNTVKEGADLTHPKPSVNYVVGFVVAVAVIGVGLWIYGKLKAGASGVTGKVASTASGLENQASKQLEGFL